VIEPKIDDLLARVDSKYSLVILAARRAREINSYYQQLGEGRAEFIPPLVECVSAMRAVAGLTCKQGSRTWSRHNACREVA
jgi:DNA-directed RNA polymerase omega subunit